jgi:glycosyltransferase involved in cell wall biosynthesis
LDSLQDDNIYSVFIGDGPLKPTCRNILHCGPLQHDEIPRYLSAADLFVLPTKAEGCCNAIVEAMACGLPIISSNLPFNADILDEDRAIMIDPTDVDAIARAIRQMKENTPVRQEKAHAALQTARSLSIDRRAQNILAFMGDICNNGQEASI